MAILLLNQDIDEKIDVIGKKINEIEYLLEHAPQRLEAYGNALDLLKNIKRGIPRKEAAETLCSECCPPGKNPEEDCQAKSCPVCWLEYIDSIKPE